MYTRLASLATVLMMTTVAQAQDSAKTYTITVTAQDLQVLSAALDELPRKVSEPLVQKFQQQLTPQFQPPEAKKQDQLPKN